MGRYDVPPGEGGMYGLVFDNTHSKSFSKTVTFVLMTYPTNAPPKSGHHPRFPVPLSRKTSASVSINSMTSPALPAVNDSVESLPQLPKAPIHLAAPPKPGNSAQSSTKSGATFYTGVLQKKRRKKAQGWARRFFSLDFATSTLSYYKNSKSSALRGAIPLALAVIGANRESRQISIDSGTEIWHLKTMNERDFTSWHEVLQRAAQIASAGTNTPVPTNGHHKYLSHRKPIDDREWEVVETLVGKVSGITDSVRRLAQDTDPKYKKTEHDTLSSPVDDVIVPLEDSAATRRAFWKRTNSNSGQSPNRSGFKRPLSLAQPRKASTPTLNIPSTASDSRPRSQTVNIASLQTSSKDQVHDRCMAVLRDLDAVVAQFSTLLAESRQRRSVDIPDEGRRQSLDSVRSQEFFDAEEGIVPHIVDIDQVSDTETAEREENETSDTDSTSEREEDAFARTSRGGHASPYPPLPTALDPLPHNKVNRRNNIPPSSGAPPSLISFLRKNVGKDLSTIAMPVTANEPLSLLERQAESLEYSQLLDLAATTSMSSPERLLYIAAFALSPLSASRVKERAIRKPFNPMLGETYELVREDRGFRFLAEKISHRPVRVACQAESKHWTFLHAPLPTQKFWGKSAELITEGRARVILYSAPGENGGTEDEEHVYSWTPATCFLRNIIAGEKYVEPTATMTITHETSGSKAVVTFKAGGMFSGRSEEVTVTVSDPNGNPTQLSMSGKWTEKLILSTGKTVWQAAELVKNAPMHYGMTGFAAELNEVTTMEKEALPCTDSRLRPDQRKYEEGDVEAAERLKAGLEEGQRRRRKEMESAGEEWAPRWFEKVEGASGGTEGDEVWRLKSDSNGYWGERKKVVEGKGAWDVKEVFQV